MADDTAQELASLEEQMQDPRTWFHNHAGQERYKELAEAEEAGTSAPVKPSGAAQRIAEIEEAMSGGPDSPYWHDQGMRDEYLRLIEGEDESLHAEPGMAELQEAVEGIDEAMGGLSDTLQGHLLHTYDDAEAPSSPAGADDVATFGGTRHGALLAKLWGADTARHLGVALARFARIERDMSEDDLADWRDLFFNRITTKERAVLVGYVAQQP